MGGICGWIGASPDGRRPAAGARASMLGSLGHRRPVEWMDWSGPETVTDSSFNGPGPVAAAWAAWGSDPAAFASRLEGSFAVAALDLRGGRLVLARDPLGEKPLYYTLTGQGVAFASEIKALAAAGMLEDLSLSPTALDAYLAFTYVPAPWTIFEHVRKVPAGHCVSIDLSALAGGRRDAARTSRYWVMPERSGETSTPERMLEELDAALGRRMPESGDAACFLSGGLDSSLVAALAARRLAGSGRRLATFSVGFAEGRLDESRHARRVAGLLDAEHRVILLREAAPGLVTQVLTQLDEPMADAACIPTWALAAAASERSRVVLTGDGADALLAGDHWFRRLGKLDRLERAPGPFRRAVPVLAGLAGPAAYRRYRDLVNLLDLKPAERYLRIREKWSWQERSACFDEEFRRRVDPTAAEASYLRAPVDWRPAESVDAALRLDSIHGLPEDLLMKADKMGMAHGVESRSPFLDRRFVEWAARLEIPALLRRGVSKYLLKKAAERLLPRDLVHRRKHGFQVPIGRWLKGSLRPLTEAAFEPDFIRRQGIFDEADLAAMKARFEREPAGPAFDGRVWQIVAFQTWFRSIER
ncbi:MAG TPA: asparagine synthase (glutamine-hydrolyzing) [Candidatus Polarisedimenticolia bacterium]|nr:asparagine synthase (glutamine-hydrolyzing) [Candidatus Polarisedimenticolia bacterium]